MMLLHGVGSYHPQYQTCMLLQNVTSTSAVLQLAPVDYSGFNEFSLALSAYPLADNLLIDLLFIGINADNLTLGEPTFQYGEPVAAAYAVNGQLLSHAHWISCLLAMESATQP